MRVNSQMVVKTSEMYCSWRNLEGIGNNVARKLLICSSLIHEFLLLTFFCVLEIPL